MTPANNLSSFEGSRGPNVSQRTLETLPVNIGRIGEEAACRYLRKKGYTLVVRNWRCFAGELDAVAWDGDALVIVEIKSRVCKTGSERFLFDTLTVKKQRKLRVLADLYPKLEKLRPKSIRIDVIGVLLDPLSLKAYQIKHLKAVV